MGQKDTATDAAKGKPLEASSAKEFKRKVAERDRSKPLKLPATGLTVLCKRPAITALIQQGIIPDQIADKIINTQGGAQRVEVKDLPRILELQQIVAKHSITSPEVVDEPDYDKNQISVKDIDPDDLTFIFQYVAGVEVRPKAVTTFRGNE